MSKKILIGLFLVTLSVTITAQNYKFSVVVNPLVNWMKSDVRHINNDGTTFGFDAGLTVDKFFAEKYALSSGISIGSYGGQLLYKDTTDFNINGKNASVPGGSRVKYNLQYITIPIGFKFKSIQIGYITYYANLGLYAQANINAKASSNDAIKTLENDNVSKEINFFNIGYQIGGGIEYSLGGSTALILGVHYMNGFTDVTKSSDDKITNSSLAIRLGVLF